MRLVTVALLLCSGTVAEAAEERSIRVTAKSEIKVEPDEVILQLAVRTRDEELLNARHDNDRITSAVLALGPAHAIHAVDVKVTDMDVTPDYGRFGSTANRQPTPIAYDFSRTIQVRLTDFEKIQPFLSAAFDAGLSNVDRLHFRVSNQREFQFEARKLAVTYAREKAEHLTQLTGMKLGLPIRIEEEVEHN
jgi:uncharacterized protein YggE